MKTNYEMLTDLGINLNQIKTTGKTKCPKCGDSTKTRNKKDLSVDVENGLYKCHNPGCEFVGKVKNDMGFVPKPKEYDRPKFHNRTDLSEKVVKYFEGRCIKQGTLLKMKVTDGLSWMPKPNKEVFTMQFNYFRRGELINTKFRDKDKGFKMVKNAELIFYNYDSCIESDWCVIVEGEPDCLSYVEAGVGPVLSVPNGASISSAPNLEYLDNCIELFENKKLIILATDNDEPGMILRDELARRLGYDRCVKVDFKDCKDANEYLKAYGPEALLKTIDKQNTIDFPMEGIITANDIWEDVEYLLKNGLQRGVTTEMIKSFDKLVSFQPGLFMALTGIPNHGKSPFALMIMCCLAVNHGWKWGIFSPEHNPLSIFVVKICEMLLGKRMRSGKPATDREMELAKAFVNEHFFFIQPKNEDLSVTSILEHGKSLVFRKGIMGLLIDPWNKLEHLREKGEQETDYVSRKHDEIIRFNQKHKVFSIVIAHPAKMRKDLKTGLHEIPSLYDISGSANWFNKPDIGISWYRNFKTGNNEIHVQKNKYEHLGEQGMAEVKYNFNNSRFSDLYASYDNNNWLLPKNEQSQIDFTLPPVQLETVDFTQNGNADDEDLPF